MAYRFTGLGGTVTDVASAAVNVATDPCLGQVAQLVNTLHSLQGMSGMGALGATAPMKGIGLCSAVPALKTAVWLKQRPWVLPAASIATVIGLVGLGYLFGSQRRRT